MNADDPIAYFITWSVYGTHLRGDVRGWRERRKGNQLPQPRLAEWHDERLNHAVILLLPEHRQAVEAECRKHSDHRGWHLWAINARTNHVHAVISATQHAGNTVRDQLKANCTRRLRGEWNDFSDRPVWSVGDDWECINNIDDLESVCFYVRELQ
ncbi:hypothetical protein [Anatilimnocola floriformis]|uniref:hypothetical protein n=1 Tax=Anatilimnocola floriformis TaxID=2948575 RepID=UPI0020C4A961|nr:hypothetical protein [Anatilimnocola floriformis]